MLQEYLEQRDTRCLCDLILNGTMDGRMETRADDCKSIWRLHFLLVSDCKLQQQVRFWLHFFAVGLRGDPDSIFNL